MKLIEQAPAAEQSCIAENMHGDASSDSHLDTPAPAIKPRVATITTRFLRDGAMSLNGRQYPREAVDTLVQSAQMALNDSNAAPLTCYVSHGQADTDNSLQLVGKLTKVWKEGADAFASIDIPDTTAGRDIATLVATGYLKPMSLRATGAEMRMDRQKGVPQVGGSNLKLMGIDFTADPGIPDIAQVQSIVLESHSHDTSAITEVFDYSNRETFLTFDTTEETPMKIKKEVAQDLGVTSPTPDAGAETPTDNQQLQLQEAQVIPHMASGVSQSMTDSDPQSDYAKRAMPVPEVHQPMAIPGLSLASMQETHDHAAAMLGMSCMSGAYESGRVFNKTNESRLAKIHDSMAKALGRECSYESFKAASLPPDDQDGDDDDAPAALVYKKTKVKAQESKTMTPEEMMRALQESGYAVQAPKTKEELLQEQFEAKLAEQKAEQERQFNELKTLLTQQVQEAAPQRRSLVEGANITGHESRRKPLYEHGAYIKNKLQESDIESIADRSAPLPEGINPDHLLKEFGTILFNQVMQQQFLAV